MSHFFSTNQGQAGVGNLPEYSLCGRGRSPQGSCGICRGRREGPDDQGTVNAEVRSPAHFECSPAQVCCVLIVDGFDRWCRKRLLRLWSRWSRVRFPLGAEYCSGSSVAEHRYRPVCSPVKKFVGSDLNQKEKAGGVGSSYFVSGGCGFESRRDGESHGVV